MPRKKQSGLDQLLAMTELPHSRSPIAFLDSGTRRSSLSCKHTKPPSPLSAMSTPWTGLPYGEKSAEEVIRAVRSLRSASSGWKRRGLSSWRATPPSVGPRRAVPSFPLPFVGVVPAIVCGAFPCVVLGVLATRRTVEGEYLRSLIREHAAGCTVRGPAAGLVEFVEEGRHRRTADEVSGGCTEVERFKDAGIDALVLGCTHFLHLEPKFRVLLDEEGITLVDSREEWPCRSSVFWAMTVTSQNGRHSVILPRHRDALYVTGAAPIEERYGYFAAQFGWSLAVCPLEKCCRMYPGKCCTESTRSISRARSTLCSAG